MLIVVLSHGNANKDSGGEPTMQRAAGQQGQQAHNALACVTGTAQMLEKGHSVDVNKTAKCEREPDLSAHSTQISTI